MEGEEASAVLFSPIYLHLLKPQHIKGMSLLTVSPEEDSAYPGGGFDRDDQLFEV